jgi:hypothetical protein
MDNAASVHGKMELVVLLMLILLCASDYYYIISPSNIEVKRVKKATYFADNNKLEFIIWSSIQLLSFSSAYLLQLYAWTDIMFC